MEKGLFYRKAKNISEYENVISKYRIYADHLNFRIVKKILLNDDQYKNFINDFMKEQYFIKENINLMIMDQNDVVSCLLVYCKSYGYGILVYSAGYGYARYVAKIRINNY